MAGYQDGHEKEGILGEKTVPIQYTTALDWVDIFSWFFFCVVNIIMDY